MVGMADTRLWGKYSLDNLKRALKHPWMFLGELNRLGTLANQRLHPRLYDDSGTRVMAEDWDTLLILDACRYDTLEAVIDEFEIPGTLERRTSLGSTSSEFLERNFPPGEQFHDTVHVTANPHVSDVESSFHALVPLFDEEHWDPELRTVSPESVADAARRAHERYPHKRLIVHFMQPHLPPIGEKRADLPVKGLHPDDHDDDGLSLRASLRHRANGVTLETVRAAYVENLRIALGVVEDLLDDLDGKTVITADHGELLGERLRPIPVRGYMHFGRLRTEELVEVPWFVAEATDRRTITADPPETRRSVDAETVQRRLEDLGYA